MGFLCPDIQNSPSFLKPGNKSSVYINSRQIEISRHDGTPLVLQQGVNSDLSSTGILVIHTQMNETPTCWERKKSCSLGFDIFSKFSLMLGSEEN